jgi:hypothetical protein
MDFGVVFSPLPGPPVGVTRSFSDWMRAAEIVCSTLTRAGFRSIVLHVTCQFHNLPENLSARLEYLEGFGTEVIQKLAG